MIIEKRRRLRALWNGVWLRGPVTDESLGKALPRPRKKQTIQRWRVDPEIWEPGFEAMLLRTITEAVLSPAESITFLDDGDDRQLHPADRDLLYATAYYGCRDPRNVSEHYVSLLEQGERGARHKQVFRTEFFSWAVGDRDEIRSIVGRLAGDLDQRTRSAVTAKIGQRYTAITERLFDPSAQVARTDFWMPLSVMEREVARAAAARDGLAAQRVELTLGGLGEGEYQFHLIDDADPDVAAALRDVQSYSAVMLIAGRLIVKRPCDGLGRSIHQAVDPNAALDIRPSWRPKQIRIAQADHAERVRASARFFAEHAAIFDRLRSLPTCNDRIPSICERHEIHLDGAGKVATQRRLRKEQPHESERGIDETHVKAGVTTNLDRLLAKNPRLREWTAENLGD